MTAPRPILAASDRTAAKMLDLSTTRFLELVALGALPPPVLIGGEERWRIADLDAILTGKAARPAGMEDIEA